LQTGTGNDDPAKVGHAILGLVNGLFILQFFFFKFGLFTLIINTLLLLFTEWLMSLLSDPPVLQIDGFLNALLASVIISLISWLLSLVIGD
jgi:uncharacterized membrane protein YvlD (DUF360 family)